jgi:hypothetical protein
VLGRTKCQKQQHEVDAQQQQQRELEIDRQRADILEGLVPKPNLKITKKVMWKKMLIQRPI